MKKIKGFTLIEMLVVIAIVAVLLTVMMPSLVSAREQARSIYCRSSLKQMGIAAAIYTVDQNGFYPISYYSQTVSGASKQTGANLSKTGEPDLPQPVETIVYDWSWDFTTITGGRQTQTSPGLLWQGDTIQKVQQCPSYKGTDNWNGNPFSGYNYNTTYIGHGQGESVAATYKGPVARTASGIRIVLPAKTSDVKSPTRCVLFGDGEYAGGANKMMRSPFPWEGDTDWDVRLGGTQGYRHRGQTNIAWADGHATSQRDLYTETHPTHKPLLEAYNRANKNKIGFLSPDNSLYDLK